MFDGLNSQQKEALEKLRDNIPDNGPYKEILNGVIDIAKRNSTQDVSILIGYLNTLLTYHKDIYQQLLQQAKKVEVLNAVQALIIKKFDLLKEDLN